MAQPSSSGRAAAVAEVELIVRQRGAKPRKYDVPEAGFLVGTVPGCDLRLSGSGLPPVICMISRGDDGADLRRLAPMHPILINGSAKGKAGLRHGDRIGLNDVEIEVHVTAPTVAAPAPQVRPQPANVAAPPPTQAKAPAAESAPPKADSDLVRREQALAENEAQLNTFAEEVAREKQELQKLRDAVNEKELKLNQERQALAARVEQVSRQQQELNGLGKQLADVRSQLHGRYKAERDRLAKLQSAIKVGAAKLQARQRELAEREQRPAQELSAAEAARAEVLSLRKQQEETYRQKRDRLAWLQQKIRRAARRVRDGRRQLDDNRRQLQDALDGCKVYRADIEAAALELTKREETVARQEREFEESARAREAELRARLTACEDMEKQAARELEASARAGKQLQEDLVRYQRQVVAVSEKERLLEERAAALDQRGLGLHTDTRELEEQARQLEQWHTSLRDEAQELATQKQAQETVAADLQRRAADLDQQQTQFAGLCTKLERSRELLNQDVQEFTAVRDQQQEAADDFERRMEADRRDVATHEARLLQKEHTLRALEDKLQRRSEDIAAQEKAHAQESARLAQRVAGINEQQRRQELKTAEQNQASSMRAEELARLHDELLAREARWQKNADRLKEAGKMVSAARKLLDDEERRFEQQRLEAATEQSRQKEEQLAVQQQLAELAQGLPELQQQAQASIEQLNQTRQRLREHLGDLHNYASGARTDLESVRDQVHGEIEQLRRQEAALRLGRDEHNLAVAEFRQQMAVAGAVPVAIPVMSTPPTSHAEEDDIPVASEVPTPILEAVPAVAAGHDEMRGWYKLKLRSLTEAAPNNARESGEARAGSRPDILSITGDVHPADRKLADLLRSLGLADEDALDAVLIEAHKQRRSLRQALLSGGCLTLYQLAMIEAGNLDALVLGPVFAVDRVRSSARETVYRVYDPRRRAEAVLRHLGEAEVHAGHADEFREGFRRALGLRHPNLAATWEVLEIHGRPAALQEPLTGLTAADWPELVNVPGVWYRLVCQAALGLKTAHEAGLVHGHLDASRVMLTRDGTLKLCGVGEPAWLVGDTSAGPADRNTDLRALGELARHWAGALTPRRGARGRSGGAAIRDILSHMGADAAEQQFASAAELLDALEQIGDKLPANAAAWDRLVQHVRDNAIESSAYRKSA